MKKERNDSIKTKNRLLLAAGQLFAKKGFWETSNIEISQLAKVNSAAISYHFGGKENLYIAAWKYAFEESIKAHPQDKDIGIKANDEEHLACHIKALIERITDPENIEIKIMHKETANPTGLLNKTADQVIKPIRENTRNIVKKLLGNNATQNQIDFCEMSIVNQCIALILYQQNKNESIQPNLYTKLDIEKLSNHIFQFSLAGIHSIKAMINK